MRVGIKGRKKFGVYSKMEKEPWSKMPLFPQNGHLGSPRPKSDQNKTIKELESNHAWEVIGKPLLSSVNGIVSEESDNSGKWKQWLNHGRTREGQDSGRSWLLPSTSACQELCILGPLHPHNDLASTGQFYTWGHFINGPREIRCQGHTAGIPT